MRLNYVSDNAQDLLGLPHEPSSFSKTCRLRRAGRPGKIFESINEAIRSVSQWSFEGRYIKPTGEEMYLQGISAPIKMEDGLIFNGVILDITDRKQAEKEKQRLEERLRRAEKMEALSQLAERRRPRPEQRPGRPFRLFRAAAGRNPRRTESPETRRKDITVTEKGAAIIRDLLTWPAGSPVRRSHSNQRYHFQFPQNAGVREHSGLSSARYLPDGMRPASPRHQRLSRPSGKDPDESGVQCGGSHQRRGEVVIRTENRYLDKAIVGYDEVKEGDYTVLIVSDTGAGIADEHREKIFEPFYTKKAMGRSRDGSGGWRLSGERSRITAGILMYGRRSARGLRYAVAPATREATGLPTQDASGAIHGPKSVLVVDDIAEQRDVASGS